MNKALKKDMAKFLLEIKLNSERDVKKHVQASDLGVSQEELHNIFCEAKNDMKFIKGGGASDKNIYYRVWTDDATLTPKGEEYLFNHLECIQ